MAVRVQWDNDQRTIVRYIFEGKWTWNDFYPAYNQAIEMEKSMPHRVHAIIDMRKGIGVPANVLMHVKDISDKQPDNIGLSIIVTSSSFVQSLYHIGIKFYSKIDYYFRVVETLDEAYKLISSAEKQYSMETPQVEA